MLTEVFLNSTKVLQKEQEDEICNEKEINIINIKSHVTIRGVSESNLFNFSQYQRLEFVKITSPSRT